jgi:hypothetical protein
MERPPPRPYFLPAELPWDDLPENVQTALATIVAPAYHELVMKAANALERSAGASLVFLLTEEVIEQFEIGALMNFGRDRGMRDERQAAMDHNLRLIGVKQKVQAFVHQLHQARAANLRATT